MVCTNRKNYPHLMRVRTQSGTRDHLPIYLTFVIVSGLQIIMINPGSTSLQTTPLSAAQWGICVALAAFSVPLMIFLRQRPGHQAWCAIARQGLRIRACYRNPSQHLHRRRVRTHQPLAAAALVSSSLAGSIVRLPPDPHTLSKRLSFKRLKPIIKWTWVPIAETLQHIGLTFYPVYMNGIRLEALADTGAAVNLISQDFIRRNAGDWNIHHHTHDLTIGDGKTVRSTGYIKALVRFEDSEESHATTLYIVEGFPYDVALSHDFLKKTETVHFSRPGAIKKSGIHHKANEARPAGAVILPNLVATRRPSRLSRMLGRCLGFRHHHKDATNSTAAGNSAAAIIDALNLRKGEIDQRKLFVSTNGPHSEPQIPATASTGNDANV